MSRRPQAVDIAWPDSPEKALPGIISDAAVSPLCALQQGAEERVERQPAHACEAPGGEVKALLIPAASHDHGETP